MIREEFAKQNYQKLLRWRKRCLNDLVKREIQMGVSPFSKFPKIPISTLFKILNNISSKLHLLKREKIEYKVYDEIGERVYWLCDSVNAYNLFIDKFELPLYLHK